MKRKIVTLLLLVLTLCTVSSCALDSGYDGAMRITAEEQAKIQTQWGDRIVRLYRGNMPFYIAGGHTIEELAASPKEHEFFTYYMVISKDQQVRFDFSGDRFDFREYEYWEKLYPYILSPEQLFPSSVKVEAIYCSDVAFPSQDFYIYYVTNQGDYVFYTRGYVPNTEYLFPLDVYVEVAEKIVEYYRQLNELPPEQIFVGKAYDIEELYDVAPYRIDK